MSPERLLRHFNQLSEAPDAVPRLRRFILDLAVRGKLVEQDPNDEPAVELLRRISQEKGRLVKELERKSRCLQRRRRGSHFKYRAFGNGADWQKWVLLTRETAPMTDFRLLLSRCR